MIRYGFGEDLSDCSTENKQRGAASQSGPSGHNLKQDAWDEQCDGDAELDTQLGNSVLGGEGRQGQSVRGPGACFSHEAEWGSLILGHGIGNPACSNL